MKLFLVILATAGFLTAVRVDVLKRCFAAVFCTSWVNAANTSGSPEWMQVVPSLIKHKPVITGGNSKGNWISNQANKRIDEAENSFRMINSAISKSVEEVQRRIQKYDGEVRSLEQQIDKINEQNKEMLSRVTKLQAQLDKVTANFTELVKAIRQEEVNNNHKAESIRTNCTIVYKDKCFLLNTSDMTKTDAQSYCTKEGGKLADMYDKTHVNMTMKTIREKYMKDKNWVYLWLGMTYNAKTGDVFMSDGTEAKYKRWLPGEPNKGPNRILTLAVSKNPTHEDQHLRTFGLAYAGGNPLCEF